jgi:hypothetical protein
MSLSNLENRIPWAAASREATAHPHGSVTPAKQLTIPG